ncbi:MAG: extracellular solute-binding protein [Anaerocolumna sp.]
MNKKFVGKLVSLLLVLVLVIGMTGCSNKKNGAESADPTTTTEPTAEATQEAEATPEATNEVAKPDKITIMVDKTLLDEASGQKEFAARFQEITGVELEIIQPDHNTYYDQVALAFTSGSVPDAIILGSAQYAAYATQGALWDMTSAWENSDTKASGRIAEDYVNALKINDALYGFSPASGNGCVTYVRKDWLDNLGLGIPTTYDEYVEVLRAFTEDDPDGNGIDDTYGVTAAGIVGPELPWTNYLPEFWQDATPDFYQQADGTWVDGFRQESMKTALTRLKDAYSKGYIDMEVATNTTSACRDKFYAGNTGVFTYWAGKWNLTIEQNVQSTFPEAEVVAIPPIAELGTYIERQAPVWAITNASKNPEGVFKYLIESMVDGGDGQMLWTYGVEGVHYEKDATGNYVQLPDPEVPDNTFLSAHVDPVLSISTWEDPLASLRAARIIESSDIFKASSVIAPLIVPTETLSSFQATLIDARNVIVANVVTGDMTVEEGIAAYEAEQGELSDTIVAEFNAR